MRPFPFRGRSDRAGDRRGCYRLPAAGGGPRGGDNAAAVEIAAPLQMQRVERRTAVKFSSRQSRVKWVGTHFKRTLSCLRQQAEGTATRGVSFLTTTADFIR